MDLNQFPERLRSRVLSSVVRNLRAGISVRLGKLEGETLPLTVQQVANNQVTILQPAELEARARAEFSTLPYQLRIRVS
ncbi:hypothetical protein [Lewinella sp. 4G2]|uniref:hypothetical protein n=1 Tax=Lewinella sp. 4G2 TaxID=1803372 RepID=UPI0007B46EB5|nr:hypothetical protein [Lewinella sp. 4G2]OAV45034.1 hypothetical protein A3850_011285 [Lewinella sp. 4G2]